MNKWKTWIVYLLAIVAVCAAYGQLPYADFLNYDDNDYVTANSHLAQGLTLTAVRWAFTSFYACNWHPLTWLSHLLDVQLFGLVPAGHHLMNLAFHLANTLLLATLLRRLTGAFWRSLLVALLFALHPLHVESVAWVAERKDVLSTLFWLLALHAYTSYARCPGWSRYLLTLACFALGLLSKSMVVTLPLVLLLLDYWPLGRLGAAGDRPAVPLVRLLAEKLPFLLLGGATGVATLLAQKGGGAMLHGGGTLAANLAIALAGYGTYLAKMVWPVGLAFFYPLTAATVAPGRVVAAAALLLTVSGLAAWQATRRPYLLVGWGWYLVTLLPVSGLIRVGAQSVADRYSYLPLIGIFIMVVWGVWELVAGNAWQERLAAGVTTIVLVVLALLTWQQTGHWRNNQTLYSHALAVTEGNWLAEHNLGTHLLAQGDVNGALARYRESLRLNPRFDRAHNNLGRLLLSSGRPAKAIDSFSAAIASNPGFATAYLNLGHAYLTIDRPDLARQVYDKLVELDPVTAASLQESIEIAEQRIRPGP